VHWSRVSNVLGSTTMPPCGPATTIYQTKAIVGDMKSSHSGMGQAANLLQRLQNRNRFQSREAETGNYRQPGISISGERQRRFKRKWPDHWAAKQ
jgi:hypothetical protein